MKFTANRESLIKALDTVEHDIDTDRIAHIKEAVYLSLKDNTLTISRIGLLSGITTSIPVHATQGGTALVSYSCLLKTLKSVKILTISVTTNKKMRLILGSTTVDIEFIDSEHYPTAFFRKQPTKNTPKCNFVGLSTQLQSVAYAQDSINGTRPALSGVCFKYANKVIDIVAADGYRMAKSALPIGKDSNFQGTVIITKMVIPAMIRLATGQSTLWVDENRVYLCTDKRTDTWIVTTPINATFPDYPQFFSTKGHVNTIQFKTALMLEALKQVKATFPQKQNNGNRPFIILSLKNQTIVLTMSGDQKTAITTSIPCTCLHKWNKFGVNIDYLIDVLKQQTATTSIKMRKHNDPIQFSNNNSQHVLMPIYTK